MSLEQVHELLDEAATLPYSKPRVVMTEEAVRIADTLNDDKLSMDSRMELIQSCIFSGYIEKAIVAFTWCLSKYDSDPHEFGRFMKGVFTTDLLWIYKWICQHTHTFASISRAQIEKTLSDFETRYEHFALSNRPVLMQKVRTMYAMGDDPEKVEELFRAYELSNRDFYADCQACETNFRVWYRLRSGKYDVAKEIAKPLIEERESCAEVPHITFSILAVPAALAGDDDAAHFQARGYDMTKANRDFAGEMAEHIRYKVLTGQLDDGIAILERHLPWVVDSLIDGRRLDFYAAGELLLDVVNKPDVAVRCDLPEAEDGRMSLADLHKFFERNIAEISAAFDARNGNAIVSTRLAEDRNRIVDAIG